VVRKPGRQGGPVDWTFDVPYSTDIDNATVIDGLDQQNSVESLLAVIRRTGSPSKRTRGGFV
jgi:hypothetical protein